MTNLEELKQCKLETKTETFMEVQTMVSKNFQVHLPWERIPQI